MKRIFVKKTIKTVLSISLSVLLCISFAFLSDNNISAATNSIKTGSEKLIAWPDGTDSIELKLDVLTSGVYKVDIDDCFQTGTVEITVFDEYNGVYVLYEECEVGNNTYITKPLFLSSHNEYSVHVYYYSSVDGYTGGDLKIKFERSYDSLSQIDTTSIASGSLASHSIGAYGTYWLEYTPSSSGDYTFNYIGDLVARINVYEKNSGRYTYQDTVYYDYQYGQSIIRNKVVFNLVGGKTYYFVINNYDEEISCKFAALKNSKTISGIKINAAKVGFDSWNEINEDSFNYKVFYNNSSSEIKNYSDLCRAGYFPVIVYYDECIYEINGEVFQKAGNTTLTFNYLGEEFKYIIDIQSITEWLSEELQNPVGVGYEWECVKSEENQTWYDWIRVSKTGVYNFSVSGSNNLEAYSIEIIDSRNNPVQYNDTLGGWPLIAGEDYAISFIFEYKSNKSGNFYFWLELEGEVLFADTNLDDWYGSAVTYAVGCGIMKGYEDGDFGTVDGIQRQDFLVMLARLYGVEPDWYDPGNSGFSDVQVGSYYDWAVAWGKQTGIVAGYEDGRFGVGDMITREQIVTFLCRYANYIGLATDNQNSDYIKIADKYSDYGNISDFALSSVVWAVNNRVINGKTANTIVPQGNAQRCEVAQIMYNIFKNEVF